MIKLGQKVKDGITGCIGTVMAITDYLYGCRSCGILLSELKDGRPQDWVWVDEQRLTPVSKAKAGGPQPTAPAKN